MINNNNSDNNLAKNKNDHVEEKNYEEIPNCEKILFKIFELQDS